MIAHPGKNYTEAPATITSTDNGGMIEVLTSLDSKIWTFMMTMPNGFTCLMAVVEGRA